jgi:hypothetical protein
VRLGRRSRADGLRSTAQDHPNLSGGLAVLVAVTTLLELLRRAVGNRANTRITHLWVQGRQLSQNVVGSHLLQDTVIQSRKLVDELEQHVQATKETTR